MLRPARPVWEPARSKGRRRSRPTCRRWSPRRAATIRIAGWDWRYYAEKVRKAEFAFDEAELKPYLQLERIIDACFDVATRLFGIAFEGAQGVAGLASRTCASSR